MYVYGLFMYECLKSYVWHIVLWHICAVYGNGVIHIWYNDTRIENFNYCHHTCSLRYQYIISTCTYMKVSHQTCSLDMVVFRCRDLSYSYYSRKLNNPAKSILEGCHYLGHSWKSYISKHINNISVTVILRARGVICIEICVLCVKK